VGSSEFTHQDDSLAPVHTANAEQMHAYLEGAPVPNKNLKEVVMGPGAFGSPDPATLSHTLLTNGDEMMKADNAPDLEEDSGGSGSGGPLSPDSTAKAFKEAVEKANSHEELDEIEKMHDERDEPYATVDSALEKRRGQLDESS